MDCINRWKRVAPSTPGLALDFAEKFTTLQNPCQYAYSLPNDSPLDCAPSKSILNILTSMPDLTMLWNFTNGISTIQPLVWTHSYKRQNSTLRQRRSLQLQKPIRTNISVRNCFASQRIQASPTTSIRTEKKNRPHWFSMVYLVLNIRCKNLPKIFGLWSKFNIGSSPHALQSLARTSTPVINDPRCHQWQTIVLINASGPRV